MQRDPWDVEFGAFVRRLRMARHWTIAELARRMNYTPAYIGILEKGANSPTSTTMLNVAHAMNMRLSELIRMFEDEQSASRAATENNSAPQ
jgi:transcriptional regulator with XRE-family HTH domain